jgi:hypothetical protein
VLTGLINRTWSAALRNEQEPVTNADLFLIHQALAHRAESVFEDLARHVSIPYEDLRNDPHGGNPFTGLARTLRVDGAEIASKYLEYFSEPVFILHDGIHASAFGHGSYIYRSKGMRIVWLRNGFIEVYSVNASIGDDRFDLTYEMVDSMTLGGDEEIPIHRYATEPEFRSEPDYSLLAPAYFWISKLARINGPYPRAYALEHLITPPDVQRLSAFSLLVRNEIWSCILAAAQDVAYGRSDERREVVRFAVRFMAKICVEPPTTQIIAFVEQALRAATSAQSSEMLSLLHEIREQTSQIQQRTSTSVEDANSAIEKFKTFIERQASGDLFYDNKPQENIGRLALQAFLKNRRLRYGEDPTITSREFGN